MGTAMRDARPDIRAGRMRTAAHERALLVGTELRLCISWAWATPAVGVVLLLAGLVLSGTPHARYPAATRTGIELGLPLCGVFLAVPLLEREWVQGTLAQLALRVPLARVLLVRLLLVITYLASIAVIAGLASWIISRHAGDEMPQARWLAATLLTAIAPTVSLAAVALLITHLTASALSSYLAACALWLANLILPLIVPAGTRTLAFLLFGWSFPSTPDHSSWALGKIALLLVAALCFTLQLPVLRREARLIRNAWD